MFGLEWSKHKSSVNEIDGIKHSKDIIEQIGIERICNSTNIEWERKMFLDLFKNKQEQETNCQLVGSYLTKLETSRSDIGLIE